MVCVDDPYVREIIPFISRPITTYGIGEGAEVCAVDLCASGTRMQFDVLRHGRDGDLPRLSVDLNLPGRHNVLNALAAISVATELGVPDEAICEALAGFRGVGRRFTRVGDIAVPGGGVFTLIDDYGHHPAEMAATLAGARRVA